MDAKESNRQQFLLLPAGMHSSQNIHVLTPFLNFTGCGRSMTSESLSFQSFVARQSYLNLVIVIVIFLGQKEQ